MNLIKINLTRGLYFARMKENLSKPKDWKFGFTILAGKMIGLFVVISVMMLLPGLPGSTTATAADADTYSAHETSIIL